MEPIIAPTYAGLRSFCPNSFIDANTIFYVDPTPWNNTFLLPELHRGVWHTLLAPSQSGKTTRVKALIASIEEKGTFLPIMWVLHPPPTNISTNAYC